MNEFATAFAALLARTDLAPEETTTYRIAGVGVADDGAPIAYGWYTRPTADLEQARADLDDLRSRYAHRDDLVLGLVETVTTQSVVG